MVIKAKCVDFRYSKRGTKELKYGRVYKIIGFSNRVHSKNRFVKLKGFGGVEYLSRRFKILDKEIKITLPDDLYNLPHI